VNDLPFKSVSESEREQIAELDRRWARVVAGEPTVDHDEVVRWLETWGTSAFRPRR
jgi:predicted transcriptional regulator